WFLGLFLVLAVSVFFVIRERTTAPISPGRPKTSLVNEWTADEVRAQLDELDRLLDAHPPGKALPAGADAKALNEGFRWLPVALGSKREAFAPLRQRMQATLERL